LFYFILFYFIHFYFVYFVFFYFKCFLNYHIAAAFELLSAGTLYKIALHLRNRHMLFCIPFLWKKSKFILPFFFCWHFCSWFCFQVNFRLFRLYYEVVYSVESPFSICIAFICCCWRIPLLSFCSCWHHFWLSFIVFGLCFWC